MKSGLFEAAGVASASLVQIAADVSAIEQQLRAQTTSQVAIVGDVLLHTLEAGGKRLRPVFLLLSAKATGREFSTERALKLGACMEMIHMATLIHDDVIDASDTRRGRPTAASVYGNTASILSGDVYLAKAMAILASDGDIEIIRTSARMVVEMAEGEAREVEVRGDFDLSLDDHLRILGMKTAAFVECCCIVGGRVAGADRADVDALALYGRHLGLAFQIADDILDFRGNSKQTGKPRATDFREGCVTLPLIELRKDLEPSEDRFVRKAFEEGVSDGELETIVRWMAERGAFIRALNLAEQHLELALQSLDNLPQSPHRDLLRAAGRYVIQRQA
ncbi:MAG: polyprenyl synthetase family protein [Fimbriimonadaceae bacterium]|nr:polyprenyl synthetase family protein [Fimbriimonadaceae bacterium]